MGTGRENRAAIDTETVRGLLLINGGGAVALLAFLPGVLQNPDLKPLAISLIWAIFIFQLGLAMAVIHNRLRRKCSLEYSKNEEKRKKCKLFSWESKEPCVCHWSVAFMWGSIIAFLTAGLVVLLAGISMVQSAA